MIATEQAILEALNELDAAATSIRTGGVKPNLLAIFERLDKLAAELPDGANPELLHFLNRKSYEKARRLLQGRPAEERRGNCS